MLLKCCTQYASKFGKHNSGPRLEKISFHSNPKEGQCQRMFKLLFTIVLISNSSKIMLKVLQARLQQYMNCELPDVPAGFRKGIEEPENQLPTSVGSLKSKRVPEKHLLLLYWLRQSLWLCESESRSVLSDSLRPCRLYGPWNSPGQNTGVGSLSLLQGIFPTQG